MARGSGLADEAAVASDDYGEDRISALPDDALHHILFFLPSDDAVQTCVLARRWRHLWRFTLSLRVTPRPGGWTASTLTSFVNHFLLLRAAAVPVHECDILCGQFDDGDSESGEDDLPDLYKYTLDEELNQAACLWIRHALANSQPRVLRVRFRARRRLCLDDVPYFASPLLKTEELTDATFHDPSRCIDFSMCLALEDITMRGCKIFSDRISSASLARLTIAGSYFYGETRTRIATPRLVSLQPCLCTRAALLFLRRCHCW